jgi:hypothetical protein
MNPTEERKHWHNLEAEFSKDDRPKCVSCGTLLEIRQAFSNDDWEYYGVCININCQHYMLSTIV